MKKHLHSLCICALSVWAVSARAQTTTAPATPAPAAPAAPAAAAPAAPGAPAAAAAAPAAPTSPVSTPSVAGPLTINATPAKFDLGKLGTWYIDGCVSGMWASESPVTPGDKASIADLDNAMVFINKVDGVFQFFAQAGSYSFPDLGAGYIKSGDAPDMFFGTVPQAFVKIAPNSTWSLQVGKLPTLFGAEYSWSFENMNIERGLLWNQEPAVSRGAQLNFSQGPWALSLSVNDGLYSNHYSWISGSAAYTIDSSNTVSVVAGANTHVTTTNTFVTPSTLNNEQIGNLIYTHLTGPWTMTVYGQLTEVAKSAKIGVGESAGTYGVAALVDYAVDSKAMLGSLSLSGVNIAGRVEYIGSTGSLHQGAPSFLYGPASNAWSFTITPTYQHNIFFARAEASYVSAGSTTPGFAFGPTGTKTYQSRVMFETGILF